MEALKCPVCDGRQFVEIGFYGPNGALAVNHEKCRSCDGKGYVLAPEQEPVRYVPMPYPAYPVYPIWPPAWTTDRTPRRWFDTTTPSITWSPNTTGTITVTTNPYESTSACLMSNDGTVQ
jgi:hypothetical protein